MRFPNLTIEHLHLHFGSSEVAAATGLSAAAAAAEPTASPSRYEMSGLASGDLPVTDRKTGLMWLRDESSERLDFAAAEKHCAALRAGGFDDWRLPELDELESIRDITKHDPCLDTAVFKSRGSGVWTRTETAWSSDYAWIVNFNNGNVSYNHRSLTAFVRAVRRVAAASQ